MRCTYCVPHNDFGTKSVSKNMDAEEIFALASIFVQSGIKKIRLTGGEPLLRKDFNQILQKLSTLKIELAISTNGLLLHQHIDHLKTAGVKKINISLDTLSPQNFKEITQTDKFNRVLNNIEYCIEKKFDVKLNVVALKNTNEKELVALAALTRKKALSVRFIEFMPFHNNSWEMEKVLSMKEILELLQKEFMIDKIHDHKNDTDTKFKIKDSLGAIGIIPTITKPFCSGCNRLRLTADGKIKNCLFSNDEIDLLKALRNNENLEELLDLSLSLKHEKTGGQQFNGQVKNRTMISIGG